MTVYVDQISTYPPEAIRDAHTRRNGRRWSHMWADSLDELHAMADRIGLKRTWFQDHPRLPHYDIVPSKRSLALRNGAVEASLKEHIKVRMVE